MAYGDLFGIRGRESDLAIMASRAWASLGLALFFEGLAITMIAWSFSDDVRPIWQRLCFSVVLAFALDFFTYAVIRP
jgi:hypothetical protein